MKKYFTKYLPVDGEIKNGDIFIERSDPTCIMRASLIGDKIGCDDYKWRPRDKEECSKVKLFLCSRDIQAGDKLRCYKPDMSEWTECEFGEEITAYIDGVYYESYQCKFFGNKVGGALKENFFKVIGEISEEISWVKGDDEFEDGDFLQDKTTSLVYITKQIKDFYLLYIEVDEDLEVGDKCRTIADEVATYTGIVKQGHVEVYSFEEYGPEDYYRVETNSVPDKVKPFICTKNIKAGDKIIFKLGWENFWIDGVCEKVTDDFIYLPDNGSGPMSINKKTFGYYHKVVGEVASEYNYFSEGSTFTEAEISKILKKD